MFLNFLKPITSILSLILVLAAGTLAQTRGSAREVLLAHQRINQAFRLKNVQTLLSLVATDFVGTSGTGEMVYRTQLINSVLDPNTEEIESKEDDVRVRVFGDVAILTYQVSAQNAQIIGDTTGRSRETEVFVKRRKMATRFISTDLDYQEKVSLPAMAKHNNSLDRSGGSASQHEWCGEG